MPHWDEVQVGDLLQMNDSDEIYHIVAKVKDGTWWMVDFKCLRTSRIYTKDPRQGLFSYARIITTTSTQEKVIAKIKYLDKRYHARKQLATNTSS